MICHWNSPRRHPGRQTCAEAVSASAEPSHCRLAHSATGQHPWKRCRGQSSSHSHPLLGEPKQSNPKQWIPSGAPISNRYKPGHWLKQERRCGPPLGPSHCPADTGPSTSPHTQKAKQPWPSSPTPLKAGSPPHGSSEVLSPTISAPGAPLMSHHSAPSILMDSLKT